MQRILLAALFFATTALLTRMCTASAGDTDARYLLCVIRCRNTTACNASAPFQRTPPLSPLLRALRWTCADECRYACMRRNVALRRERDERIVQYHGKWPFARVLGVQEFASVVASVGNLFANVFGALHIARWFLRFRRRQRVRPVVASAAFPAFTSTSSTATARLGKTRATAPVSIHLILSLGYCAVACNAWLWSSVFHARDTAFTERMDYLSAVLLAAYLVAFSSIRVLALIERLSPLPPAVTVLATLTLFLFSTVRRVISVLLLAFSSRRYASSVLAAIDYGSHVWSLVGVGALLVALWSVWCVRHWRTRRYAHKCVYFFVWLAAAASLELGDFPPWFDLIDAHALWHFATIYPSWLWCSFLHDDLEWTARTLEQNERAEKDTRSL